MKTYASLEEMGLPLSFHASYHWNDQLVSLIPYSPLGRGFLTRKIDETTTFGGNDNRSSSGHA
jgi:hypothetical protein